MCSGLTDGTLTRKYAGLNVLAEVKRGENEEYHKYVIQHERTNVS